MKLNDYLEKRGESVSSFARRAFIEGSTAHRAARGKVTPSPDTMRLIHAATNGKVTPNDFFEVTG